MRTTYCPKCDDKVRYYTDFGAQNSWLRICTDCETDLNYNFKLCIIAAGKGTRNKGVDGLHKALLPLENRPVISHILDNYDDRVEVVIAVGYESEQIKSYLLNVYPNKKFTFVDVDNFDGPGAGPGYSLLSCKSELQQPFIYTAVDTIVTKPDYEDAFVFLSENWIGASDVRVQESSNYCLIKSKDSFLEDLYYGKGTSAYIGLAGVAEYEKFWTSLENKENGHFIHKDDLHEYQADSGFRGLSQVKVVNFEWFDTGNTKSYNEVRKVFNNEVVANKSDEALFIDNKKVVKYFSNKNKSKVRVERLKYMNDNPLEIEAIHENMYSYDFIDGDLLSEINDVKVFESFLEWYKSELDTSQEESRDNSFRKDCDLMYGQKTLSRLKKMENTTLDKISNINGTRVEPIKDLLQGINWDDLYTKLQPSKFHGDLQLENIIYSKDNKFILIDWRQTFGNSKKVGDLYYDLGKIWHSLPINGKSVLNEMYSVSYNENKANINFYFKNNLLEFYKSFEKFSKENYDWDIICLIGILHYLNICTLYDNFQNGKYGEFLFLLGKLMLTKFLKGEEVI